jgi:hypothetical protein
MNRQLSTSISGKHHPENLAGEGYTQLQQILTGEGFVPSAYPSPDLLC